MKQLLFVRYRDILDNRDNFVVNIEIYFLALLHTSTLIMDNIAISAELTVTVLCTST